MPTANSTHPTLIRRLLHPKGEYRTGALRAMVRVHWFIRLRWLAIAVGALACPLAARLDVAPNRCWYLLAIVGGLLVINLIWRGWSGRINRLVKASGNGGGEFTNKVLSFANAQMALDLMLLTLVIWLFGGVISPLAIFYVFHVAIAALLLAPANALLQALWALLLYGVVVFGGSAGWLGEHMPIVGDPAVELPLVHSVGYAATVYSVVAAGLLGTWYLVTRAATKLDAREEELRHATDALVASHEAIDELQARRARFMRTAAHQLKSPLAGIQTMAGLISDGVATGSAIKETTDKIIRRSKDAIEQVNELLVLARLKEEGARRHRTARTDVLEVLDELLEDFRPAAEAGGVRLSLEVGEGIAPRVRVDRRDLKDCLGNLVDNAIKYAGEGKCVEVTVASADGEVTVIVRDQGVGIAPETLDFMFDEFRRGNQALAMQIAGSGLGLSIVREVLEQVGGRINISSVLGQGSTFQVWLPLAAVGGPSPTQDEAGVENRTEHADPFPREMKETAHAGPNRREAGPA